MKNIGRAIAFSVALIAIIAAVGSVVWLLTHSASDGGGFSLSLCGLSSPDDFLIGLYLDTKAAQLEQPAGDDDTPVTFVVEVGETAAEIGSRLEQEGLIADAELFRRYVQYHGLDAGIEAGEFTLRQTMTIPEIAQALQKGQRPEQVITIQEGLRLEQVAAAVAEQTNISPDDFLALVTTGWRDSNLAFDFLSDLSPGATLEGFLFPATYRLPEEGTAVDLVGRMLGTFGTRVSPEMRAAAASHGLSVYELVTLASIVEREAVLDEERPLIAGVYHNRLESGWFLSACPTVQYALGTPDEWWPQFTLEATDVDSPYNTYRHLGLPPGPICNPGLASIQAAAHPADTDYFFFLADCTKNDGSHLFAVTQEEHNHNYERCGGEIP
ncbi:MAG: endolytic transglycosylase MltG [Anaerolineae bacterium]